MSVKSEIIRIRNAKKAIIDSISSKGVEVPVGAGIGDLPDYISAIQAGGGGGNTYLPPDNSKDIKLYDYDGSLLYSFSHEEISSMTSLPDGPVHEGLVFQGWNWTTDELKAITGKMNVGAMYITDDEATRLIIDIPSEDTKNITIAISQNVSAGVTINWGDGSSSETVTGTGNKLVTHEYPSKGGYTISLLPLTNCTLKLGHTSSGYNVMGVADDSTRVYSNMLRAVHLGRKVTAISSYAFQYCRGLEYITISQAVTSMGNYSFNYASSLRCAVVPAKVTQISTFTFGSCFTLTIACLPKKCANIGASSFRYCYNLYSITIPPGLTTLNGYAFSECYSLRQVYIPDTVKTVGNFVFYKCYSLNDLYIPDSVTSVGSNSFYQNYALGYLDVPSSATSFGTYSFYDCHALAQITIPQGVTEIKAYAFMNCFGLRKVYVLAQTPPAMDPTAFTGISDECEIVIPAGTLAAYSEKNGWDDYVDYLREAE